VELTEDFRRFPEISNQNIKICAAIGGWLGNQMKANENKKSERQTDLKSRKKQKKANSQLVLAYGRQRSRR